MTKIVNNSTNNNHELPEHILRLDDQELIDETTPIPFTLFRAKTMPDLRNDDFRQELVEYVKENPEIDWVYHIDLPEPEKYGYGGQTIEKGLMNGHIQLHKLPYDTGKGLFVGGSCALKKLMDYIKQPRSSWENNDVDLFFMGCDKNSRLEDDHTPNGLDFVFCKDKTIEEVLLNFDLPCCRVGFDFKYNFYVSAQALCAIFSGKMYLPRYMKDDEIFTTQLRHFYDHGKPKAGGHVDSIIDLIINRLRSRIIKYSERGFKVEYSEDNYELPWVKNRFTYNDLEEDEYDDMADLIDADTINQDRSELDENDPKYIKYDSRINGFRYSNDGDVYCSHDAYVKKFGRDPKTTCLDHDHYTARLEWAANILKGEGNQSKSFLAKDHKIKVVNPKSEKVMKDSETNPDEYDDVKLVYGEFRYIAPPSNISHDLVGFYTVYSRYPNIRPYDLMHMRSINNEKCKKDLEVLYSEFKQNDRSQEEIVKDLPAFDESPNYKTRLDDVTYDKGDLFTLVFSPVFYDTLTSDLFGSSEKYNYESFLSKFCRYPRVSLDALVNLHNRRVGNVKQDIGEKYDGFIIVILANGRILNYNSKTYQLEHVVGLDDQVHLMWNKSNCIKLYL